jgi:ribosomal protein L11 methyltransferase
MGNYIEIEIHPIGNKLTDIVIAELSQIGFSGFEENSNSLKAFIEEEDFEKIEFKFILNKYELKYSRSTINEKNWNEVWESNFDPVIVDDFVSIRAHFHQPVTTTNHEIVITPKMSFGTGHHATTFLVMQLMRKLDIVGKKVFDFGTGTGILAILAEKLGAAKIFAGDNDDWCIENASENIINNACKLIDLQKIDSAELSQKFNIVIANINKNIIQDNFRYLDEDTLNGADILLSGLLKEDEQEIIFAADALHWQHIETVYKNGWIAMWFKK